MQTRISNRDLEREKVISVLTQYKPERIYSPEQEKREHTTHPKRDKQYYIPTVHCGSSRMAYRLYDDHTILVHSIWWNNMSQKELEAYGTLDALENCLALTALSR